MRHTFSALLILCATNVFAVAPRYITVPNGWTGRPDYVANVTSQTIPSGSTYYIQNTLTPSTTTQAFSVLTANASSMTVTRGTISTMTTRSIVFRDPDNSNSQNWILSNIISNSTVTWTLAGATGGQVAYFAAGGSNPTISFKWAGNTYANSHVNDATEFSTTDLGPGGSYAATATCLTFNNVTDFGGVEVRASGTLSTSIGNNRAWATILQNGNPIGEESQTVIACGMDKEGVVDCPATINMTIRNPGHSDVYCVGIGNDDASTQVYWNRVINGQQPKADITLTETP